MDRQAPPRYHLLDGMRGVAALCVLAYHEAGLHGGVGILGHSYLAVDFFFILSGFVLTRAFEHRFAQGMGTAAFLSLRCKRLYPLMAIAALVGAAEAALSGRTAGLGPTLVRHLLFVPRLVPGQHVFELNGAQWSLLLEIMANWAHVALLWRARTALVVALSAVGGVVLLGAALRYGTLNLGWNGTGAWVGIARVACFYGIGVVMGRALPHITEPQGRAWRMPLLALPAAIVATVLVPGEVAGIVVAWATTLLVFPAIIVAALHMQVPARAAAGLSWLGRLSFPLYALHLPLLMLVNRMAQPLPGEVWVRIVTIALVLVVSAALAQSSLGGRPARRRTPMTSLAEPA